MRADASHRKITRKMKRMFKTEAYETPSGNWLVEFRCSGGHKVFKNQTHPNDSYKCPYCGHDLY